MKILLINPISGLAQRSNRYYRSVSPLPPLGLAYLAGTLKTKGIEVRIEDQYASRKNNLELINYVKKQGFNAIGISCLTTVMDNVKSLIKEIRLLKRPPVIILGNIHPTIFADELLKERAGDIIVRGEGEQSLLETLLALKRNADLSAVKGISYLDNGYIKHNPRRECFENLDDLAYPAWDLLNLGYYTRYPMLGIYNASVLPIHASRGCPYNCIFCSQEKMYATPRYRNIQRVVDEIEFLHQKYGINYAGFTDAYFPFSIESGFEFCNELIKRKLHRKIRWFTETRVDKVNLGLLKKMKESNIYMIMYGFESGNQRILDSVNKKITIRQARQAMRDTKKAGIVTLGLFMLGLPDEDKTTCKQTIRFAKELDPDIVKFNLATPFPGSRFFLDYKDRLKDCKNTNKYTSWYDWAGGDNDGGILYSPQKLTKRELLNLQRRGMFGFYMRPGAIIRHIIRKKFSWTDMLYGGYILIKDYLNSFFKKNESPAYKPK